MTKEDEELCKEGELEDKEMKKDVKENIEKGNPANVLDSEDESKGTGVKGETMGSENQAKDEVLKCQEVKVENMMDKDRKDLKDVEEEGMGEVNLKPTQVNKQMEEKEKNEKNLKDPEKEVDVKPNQVGEDYNDGNDVQEPMEEVEEKAEGDNGGDIEATDEEMKEENANQKVEPDRRLSENKCFGETDRHEESGEKENSTANDDVLHLKLISNDEESMETRNETKDETEENLMKRAEDEPGREGAALEEAALRKEEVDVSSANKSDPDSQEDQNESKFVDDYQASGDQEDQNESKSADDGLDRLHKLEPIWMKR